MWALACYQYHIILLRYLGMPRGHQAGASLDSTLRYHFESDSPAPGESTFLLAYQLYQRSDLLHP